MAKPGSAPKKKVICGAEIVFSGDDNSAFTATCKLPKHEKGDHQGYMTEQGEVYVQCGHCKSHVKRPVTAVVTWKNLGMKVEDDDEHS